MSVWGTDPGITGYMYPGSQCVPENVHELPRVPDAVMVATVRMDEGTDCEVTSKYLRLDVMENEKPYVGATVLLDVYGAKKLKKQLKRFVKWRESKMEVTA